MMEIDPRHRKREPESRWQSILRGIWITLGSVGLAIGVIFTLPQDTTVTDPPIYSISNGVWTLLQDYSITVSDMVWTVKAGFNQWDGLSIPPEVTNALHVTRYDYPAESLFHDSAYASISKDGRTYVIPKDKADACLRLLLLSKKCATNRADIIERMVSAWGFNAISRHTPESVARARSMVTVTTP
jgi:hypothetical protein